MKKLLATLLTGCLVLQSCIFSAPVSGISTSAKAATTATAAADDAESAKTAAPASVSKEAEQPKGALEVEVRSSSLYPYKGKVMVQLSHKSTKELEFSSTTAEGASEIKTAHFSDVEAGTYTVTVSANKFADYTQEVTVEANYIHKIIVGPAKIETEKEGVHSGWLQIGDVDRTRTIDENDTTALLSDIRSDNPNPDYDSDLNSDGKIDLADLQCLVKNQKETKLESSIEKLILISSKNVTVEGKTMFTSNTKPEHLAQGQNVTLTRTDNAAPSKDTPIEFSVALPDDAAKVGGIRLLAPSNNEDGTISSQITDGEVIINDNEDDPIPLSYITSSSEAKSRKVKAGKEAKEAPSVSLEGDGSLVLNLNGQIAVKRVTIKIFGTKKDEKLVNIAKVEFVNDMESRIPAPALDIPTINKITPGDKELQVSWTKQNNVTGYELFVEGPVKGKDKDSQVISVTGNTYTISMINNADLINYKEYTIKVRSVNGDWKSPYSDEAKGTPKPTSKPEPVDNVSATGGFHSILVKWKDMSDAIGYMVYYKKTTENNDEFKPVVEGFTQVIEGTGRIEETSYTIPNLENDVSYTIYVIGWNELGWGRPSLEHTATPKDAVPPLLPNYKLLNTSNGEGKLSAHITAATIGGHGGAKMVASPLDTEARSGLGLVDNDYGSYWTKTDWDDGISYPGSDRGFFITLDKEYKMNFLTFAAMDEVSPLELVRIEYWNTTSDSGKVVGARLFRKQDKNGNYFYIAKFNNTVTANKVHISLGRGYARAEMKVGEIHFHMYDSLEDDIMNLYVDDMHTTLKSDVNAQTITELKGRLETIDTVSGEKHPLYSELKLELENAEYILTHDLSPSYKVDNRITGKKDGHLGFGGLNPWQPLGKSAYAGEELVVYVGHNTKRTGDSTDLQLVMTQYHAEASAFVKTASLKVGRNVITVPSIVSLNYEKGGQLYIAYNGNNTNDQYAVRVLGGSDIPTLSVYGKTGEERTNAIKAYITELEKYVTTIEETHKKLHKDGHKSVDYDYDKTNCILNATDIMMDQMMYSIPAEQAWAGIKNASDKVATLDKALLAMENTMQLFYHHKGLSNDTNADKNAEAARKNALPSQHLNIRYMRMFAGAFMYASGNHIGVEWGSSALTGTTNFGWGIAHEIGHDINQGTYAVAEVTNNYFSQLLTGTERYQWPNVYNKVTSGTIGRSTNVFTQLALYWQLHMAFDNNKDDQYIYDNYEDQFNNLFFARVDTYSRNPSKAPQSGLALNGGTEQNLMRLSCAAANKNILPFFERWGMVPDAGTMAYAEKYGEPETKALYYVNPEARNYRVEHKKADGTIDETGTIAGKDVVTATAAAKSNQVELSITTTTSQDKDLILGYEIIRSMTSNGKTTTKVVGFQPINKTSDTTTFTDTVTTINNRVMTYEVKAVDKFLNYSNSTSAGSVKIQTDGVLNKASWTVETDMTSGDDTVIESKEDDPDSGYHDTSNLSSITANKVNSIERIIDNDKTSANGTYKGTSTGTAKITIDMHETKEITALKYQGSALASVTIEVSDDNSIWKPVKENYTELTGSKEQTIWFDSVQESERQSWIGTYDARYVRLTISQAGEISINEIEICGPSGDNMEFLTVDTSSSTTVSMPAIGVLSSDYTYGKEKEDVIPQGSLVFTGVYKGNPAYNIVVLYDTEGNVIGAKDGVVAAGQVILADVPKNGNLGETSNGTWIYYVEPDDWNESTLKAIKGVRGELYRVDDAKLLEGERIVSDTHVITIPAELPEFHITGGSIPE